jgi:hypothetical protein
MKIIVDTYVYVVEIAEAPDDLKIGELKKIMGDITRELARTARRGTAKTRSPAG